MYYFIGIKGSGMSALAAVLNDLGYEVKGTKTKEIITFVMEGESEDEVREKVDDMCQKLLCNPIIHNYTINIIKMDLSCGCGCE